MNRFKYYAFKIHLNQSTGPALKTSSLKADFVSLISETTLTSFEQK